MSGHTRDLFEERPPPPASGADDAYLHLPLHGLQLIEASAGTGKTYTLATLVTRLVIERSLRVGQILAVTFTDAATQELRERLRKRLLLAARIAADDPALPIGEDDGERAVTRALIAARRDQEAPAALRARLARAAREIDLAAVVTIHGFCARVLSEHALETGQAFLAPEMIGSDRELRDEVAVDLWRSLGTDAVAAELLQARWPAGPSALAADLGPLLRAARLKPALPVPTPDPWPLLQARAAVLRDRYRQHGAQAFDDIEAAMAAKVLNGQTWRAELPAALREALTRWCANEDPAARIEPRIDRMTPAALAERTNKGKQAQTPSSPLFVAIADYLEVATARAQWLDAQGLALVHRVREEAAARLAELKRVRRVQTYDDLIDGVAQALSGPHAAALVARLRAQYAVALVDEFQDTDARQWAIFERVFGPDGREGGSLFVIGDPKQAIYGFRGGDVHTYLAAAAQAELAPPLLRNFRSRPSLLRAVQALYQRAGADAFVDARIRFLAVEPGGRVADEALLRHGRRAPALTLRRLPAPDNGAAAKSRTQWSAPESRELATRACVAAIHAWLADARKDEATLDGRALQPADIAVLVRSHDEAARMQRALVAAGIPAVAAGRQSVFATEQALELLALFEALLQPGDHGRLRGALASVFLGLDARAIARMDAEDAWQRDWQLRALEWRERWQRHGPLALVADLCAQQAPRLLALGDGERRLTNLLQLGEVLQEADAQALGLHGLVDWLRLRIAEADDNDEQQQLRLESDARRVQILTLHKSKGLEFGLVFLPFAAIGREPRGGRHCEYPDDDGRVLQLEGEHDDAGTPPWSEARVRSARESAAEDARLLYVGLTRARHALWLATGPLYLSATTPLAPMLDAPETLDSGDAGDVEVDDRALETRPAPLPPIAPAAVPPARSLRRGLPRDWWVHSFTQLTREDAGSRVQDERGAEDEPEPLALPAPSELPIDVMELRFSGSRFGNAVHTALERCDFAVWGDWRRLRLVPEGQEPLLRTALHEQGYTDADIDSGGLDTLARLVGATLTATLPEGARLADLPPAALRAEMEFHFALNDASTTALLELLHAHGWLRARQAFGHRRRLDGLMTGKIDLVYAHEGRYYLLDYKTNRLPSYDAAAIERAMDDSEYTLQSLIYTLALHRWLRFRLGADYDYARDFGGTRYLFCRGLDPMRSDEEGAGIHAEVPPRALVEALDALFGGAGGAS
ncbi:UvrD-helicase domain-containing protein [Lysobacter sp. cf310]|uniref:UvrD-helicase domain-containing protein n=1 Tax=Lysobacter sp. cf310 TaxID=1761790 RepID=UPI0008E0665E|nr:exodeoxyribonuclease V subunit beta [Lysobacter sp. cf310]SFL11046.1 DNA helicase/exodeoxyribonuclease V, beta subunit [Lysobacter sp. cf310]